MNFDPVAVGREGLGLVLKASPVEGESERAAGRRGARTSLAVRGRDIELLELGDRSRWETDMHLTAARGRPSGSCTCPVTVRTFGAFARAFSSRAFGGTIGPVWEDVLGLHHGRGRPARRTASIIFIIPVIGFGRGLFRISRTGSITPRRGRTGPGGSGGSTGCHP